MVDDFANWVQDLEVDDFIKYGDLYAKVYYKSKVSDLLEACRLAHECIVTRAGVRNNASEKDKSQDRSIIDKTIEKLEQVIADFHKEE